ncbi:MAG: FAD-dependent oxidoreductase [Gaiellaceae bacterium]
MPAEPTYVVVGASLAGARAAEALREQGFDGRIELIGAEAERPYNRPPLSKGFLLGETPRDKVFVHAESFYADNEIELRRATTVEAIDTSSGEVVLAGSERSRFDRLLLATGAEPRRLSVPGAGLDGILYLRDLDDAERLRDRIEQGGRAVFIGAGWIGAEVAAVARETGLEVTIVERGSVPLERVLGREVGAVFADLHREHGVDFRSGTTLEGFEGNGSVERVRTTDGRQIEADVVVVGIGVIPRTSLAEQAGIRVENGILVDEHLQTSVPGIFAAGDVANARHPLYGQHLRFEHWSNARYQGPAAAASMLGGGDPYGRIPFFFSEQYDVAVRYSGYAARWDEVVFRGDPATREFMVFWLADGRVLAGMDVNAGEGREAVEALILASKEIDRARLADLSVPLATAISEPVARGRRSRGNPLAAATGFVADGLNFTRRFVGDRLSTAEAMPVDELADGEARISSVDGAKVAVYKDETGSIHAVSPVCTHMRCLVDWNAVEKTWDCPCHGSRFDVDGHVLEGPAKRDLEPKEVPPGSAR